jgi:RND family efflux transporter MFP subunit
MIVKTHLRWLAISAGVLFAFGCSGGHQPAGGSARTVSDVAFEVVKLESVPKLYEGVGTVRPRNISILSAQLSGTVRAMLVKAGDRVRKGELVAVLDGRAPQSQLAAAEAGAEAASEGLVEARHALQAATAQRKFTEATYKRYQRLLAENSVSRQEFEEAQTSYQASLANEQALEARIEQLEAQERQARAQQSGAETILSYARVTSPLNGVVTVKSVDVGTVVMPGMPLLTIEDNSQYRLEASLPEEFLNRVRTGEAVPVTVGNQAYQGRVTEIVPAADPSSRTFTVKVSLPPGCACQSGGYGTAQFPVGETRAVIIPKRALRSEGELVGVFVANAQGMLDYRLVKTGEEENGDRVSVLAGLNPGDRIAISKVDQLRQGDRVEAR